jgi:hypothetical protein
MRTEEIKTKNDNQLRRFSKVDQHSPHSTTNNHNFALILNQTMNVNIELLDAHEPNYDIDENEINEKVPD